MVTESKVTCKQQSKCFSGNTGFYLVIASANLFLGDSPPAEYNIFVVIDEMGFKLKVILRF